MEITSATSLFSLMQIDLWRANGQSQLDASTK